MITSSDIVYISGPMTGIERLNEPAFREAEHLLCSHYDCAVLNPIRHSQSKKLPYEYFMSLAMVDVEYSDIIVLLDGWHNSPGANREYRRAIEKKKKIIPMWEIIQELEKTGGKS